MTGESKPQISIWFFIGALLAVYGALILWSGLAHYDHPAAVQLASLHASIWWGALLLVVGFVYLACFRPKRAR